MDVNGALHELEQARGWKYAEHAHDFREWLNNHEAYDVDLLGASSGHVRGYLRHLRDNGRYCSEGDRGYAPTTLHLALVSLGHF